MADTENQRGYDSNDDKQVLIVTELINQGIVDHRPESHLFEQADKQEGQKNRDCLDGNIVRKRK